MTRLKFPRRQRREPEPVPETIPTPADDEAVGGPRMGFFEHLDELRQRLFKAFMALIAGTVAGMVLATPVLEYLVSPYGSRLQTLGPTESVVSYFRVSLMLGGIIAIPIITYQVLMFVIPGLTQKESRLLLRSLPAITLLFLVGVAFAWFILVPPALNFLENFQTAIYDPQWTADQYLGFVTALLFWMGVAFETPLVFFVLALLGLVSAGNLIRNWRIAVVGAAIAAAMITPTIDPVNMFLVMGPLLGLYTLSIFLVMIGRRIAKVD
ncbi:MAG TPA: twin-arginine translocase subunit TatC [Phototrophicaceae bacterium]|nr:twin-arginine translocase subunit TatC [Phototrophicaceae bacterium]